MEYVSHDAWTDVSLVSLRWSLLSYLPVNLFVGICHLLSLRWWICPSEHHTVRLQSPAWLAVAFPLISATRGNIRQRSKKHSGGAGVEIHVNELITFRLRNRLVV